MNYLPTKTYGISKGLFQNTTQQLPNNVVLRGDGQLGDSVKFSNYDNQTVAPMRRLNIG